MVRHVVMWKFKPEAERRSKLENMEILREKLFALLPLIPEIKKMEIGFDVKHTDFSMDFMLLTEFDSLETLAVYAVHPDHLKVTDFVRNVVDTRVVLDCEI